MTDQNQEQSPTLFKTVEMKGINKIDNFKIKNLQNRSVDETAKGRFENLRDSSFDPISALSKLTISAKNNNAQFLKRIDPVS